MNEPQPEVAIYGDPATDHKLTIDGREYRRVRGALTGEWRRGPRWHYVMEPEISAALTALVGEMEPCDDCGRTAKLCFISRLAGGSGCCPDCGHARYARARRNAPPREPR